MDVKLIIELINILRWPVVVVWVTFQFRDPIESLLERLTGAKGMGWTLKFERALEAAEAQKTIVKKGLPDRPSKRVTAKE